MQCPYCAEKIKEEAKVCRHCGRELVTSAFYVQQLASLEQEVVSLREENIALERRISQEHYSTVTHLAAGHLLRIAIDYWKRIAVAAILAILVFTGSNTINIAIDKSGIWAEIRSETSFGGDLARLMLSHAQTILAFGFLGSPFLFSYLASRKWPGSHTVSYFVFGFLVGVIGWPLQLFLELLAINWINSMSLSSYLSNYIDLGWSIAVFVITPAFLFVSGGLYGDIRKLRTYPQRLRRIGLVWRIAERIAKRIPRVESERVAEGIRLLAPLLAALIGLVSAVIGLYAASLRGLE